jgi:hypothetical protein
MAMRHAASPAIVSRREQADAVSLNRVARRLRRHAAWFVYVGVALACTAYLNARAALVPKWGEWYMASEGHPYVLLQVRAFLSGRLALLPHPSGAGNDYDWGRGGMHTPWGLGAPILATPFHLLGRLFGAPGFPDDARFLILYAITTVALARALHRTARSEQTALVASSAAAGFVMVFPTFVGFISSRFLIYDHTIATGALWSVLLLSGLLALMHRYTPWRLAVLCGAAGFSTMIRPPLAVYGLTTVLAAMIVARRKGMRVRALLAGLFAYAGMTALYFAGNACRFGSPFVAGFENGVSGFFVNRLTRWGLSFAKVPFTTAAKEMFATLFLLEPTPGQIMMGTPPASVQPYAVAERWREYYAPTYDLLILAGWFAALVIVCSRVVGRRLWRPDRELGDEVATVVGAWALPPTVVLFVFYARIGNMVTRYMSDMYPAFAAALLCVGIATVDAVRKRAPQMTASAQLAIAGGVALYIAGWHGWATHLSRPIDRKTLVARIADIDARSAEVPSAPDHFKCNEPRGRPPLDAQLDGWLPDCSFVSGMVFAMPHSRCVSFSFGASGGAWSATDDESLAGFRATGDFDRLVSCGAPRLDGGVGRVTMCEPHPPPFLLDGLRLYSIASLDANLNTIDRLKLLRIDAAPSCP